MPRKLTINTSLFDPIEIEIDKKVYQAKPLTRTVFKEIEELDKQIEEGSVEAGYKLLELLLGEECSQVISGLDISFVNQITDFIISSVKTGAEEKNELKPGDSDSQ